MKIALVDPYDFSYPGGVTNHITSLAHHLLRLGQEVKIIAPASRRVSSLGNHFIRIGSPRSIPANGSIVRIAILMNLAPLVKEVLEQERFDIIHLHEPLMPLLCTTMLRLSDSVNIGTFHATYQTPKHLPGGPLDGYNFGRPITTMLLKRLVRNLDGRIAVSRPALEFASRYFSGDYTIIPNGVDLEQFHPDVLPIDEFRDGKINILFVGRLEKRKGFKYLLEAYQRVKQELANCRLIVVGPGTRLRSKFEDQIFDEGIKDVVFVGYVANDELPRFYKTADVFCAPATHCESFGVVLLEAMAVGKPIVASNVEGYAHIVSPGVEGLLVPPKDENALAGALMTLIADRALRQEMGDRGKLKAAGYGWDSVARRVLDFYIKVRSGKRQPWQSETCFAGLTAR